MSKRVELIIEIAKDGSVTVTPKGTVGPECLQLMDFLDKIEGVTVLETIANEDMGKNYKETLKNNVINKEK